MGGARLDICGKSGEGNMVSFSFIVLQALASQPLLFPIYPVIFHVWVLYDEGLDDVFF